MPCKTLQKIYIKLIDTDNQKKKKVHWYTATISLPSKVCVDFYIKRHFMNFQRTINYNTCRKISRSLCTFSRFWV